MKPVFISLTTISSRLDQLRKCLDSLINQTHSVEQILLTIPLQSMRGERIKELPDYLFRSPYKNKVTVIRPKKDYGPIMKYIGGYKHLKPNSLVFVCDDDQEYHRKLVRRLVDRYNKLDFWEQRKTVITASGTTILSTDTVYGHGSVLVPYDAVKIIRKSVLNSTFYVKRSCQRVDDNWVSIILKRNQIKVINMNLEKERFANGYPENPKDGLSQTTNRVMDVLYCTYAIDNENMFPLVALVLFFVFIIVIVSYNRMVNPFG